MPPQVNKWVKKKAKTIADEDGTDYKLAVKKARTMFTQPETSPDLTHRLVAVSANNDWVATALGSVVTIIDSKTGMVQLPEQSCHDACIQVLVGSADGKFLLTGADDKHTKLWRTDTWTCMKTVTASKKVSSACFSHDGKFVLIGDKFGDVNITAVDAESAMTPFLGHFCAIITTVCADSKGRWVASGDRDGKLRVSVYPKAPEKGSWEIKAYCMGHAACITCSGSMPVGDQELLLSGCVAGQLNAWDPNNGALLASLQMTSAVVEAVVADADGAEAMRSQADKGHEGTQDTATEEGAAPEGHEDPSPDADAEEVSDAEEASTSKIPAIVAFAIDTSRCLIGVAVEGQDTVAIVKCTAAEAGPLKMTVVGEHSVGGVILPTRLSFAADGTLWAVGGPCIEGAKSVHVGTCRLSDCGTSAEQVPLGDQHKPLDSRSAVEDASAAAETPRTTQMKPWLRKKTWTVEEVEDRKKQRSENNKASMLRDQANRAGKAAKLVTATEAPTTEAAKPEIAQV